MVGLTADQAAKMKNNALSLITLSEDGCVGVLESRELLLVALSLALKLLGNLLLENKGLESIVTLLLGPREASGKTSCIVLLLVDETSETSVLTLVILNLDLEVLRLFGKLFGKSLELEELQIVSKLNSYEYIETYLLFPALKLLDKEVVSLRDLAKLGIHATLKVDEVLPSLKRIPGILISFSNNFIQMPHRHLSHEGLLDGPAKNGFHAGVSPLL